MAPRHLGTLPDTQPGRGEEGARDSGVLRAGVPRRCLGLRVRGSSADGPRAEALTSRPLP